MGAVVVMAGAVGEGVVVLGGAAGAAGGACVGAVGGGVVGAVGAVCVGAVCVGAVCEGATSAVGVDVAVGIAGALVARGGLGGASVGTVGKSCALAVRTAVIAIAISQPQAAWRHRSLSVEQLDARLVCTI